MTLEHCQKCYLAFDVDELGRVPQHRKCTGSGRVGGIGYSSIASESCPKSGHPSREEMQRRKDRRRDERLAIAVIARDEARVALDAFLEGRDYEAPIEEWRKAALTLYNAMHAKKYAHPYEYATKVAVASRRAETRGDVYCRFCGERLAIGIKDPHGVIRADAEAQRHLTICALQLLAGMREPAKPGHRALPLEMTWRDDEARPG